MSSNLTTITLTGLAGIGVLTLTATPGVALAGIAIIAVAEIVAVLLLNRQQPQ